MDTGKYLDRIGFHGLPTVDLATLRALHVHHLFQVPFEDIDIHRGIPISLHPDRIFDKVVMQGRGGYCYELNSLFCYLLRNIGFQVDMVCCRVARGRDFGAAFDHMALMVHLDGERYLADVGFGSFTLRPLLFQPDKTQSDGRDQYRIREYGWIDGELYFAAERLKLPQQQFAAEYVFSLTPRELHEFEAMNVWQQTHPDSHFVQNYLCSKPTESGRISIINHYLITTDKEGKKQQIISDDERLGLLRTFFDVQFPIPV